MEIKLFLNKVIQIVKVIKIINQLSNQKNNKNNLMIFLQMKNKNHKKKEKLVKKELKIINKTIHIINLSKANRIKRSLMLNNLKNNMFPKNKKFKNK